MAGFIPAPIAADGTTLQIVAGVLSIKAGGVGSTEIANGSVAVVDLATAANIRPLAGSTRQAIGATATYLHPWGGPQPAGLSVEDGNVEWVAPVAGTITNLRGRNATALGAATQARLTARVNRVGSALVATSGVADAIDTLFVDTTHSVTLAQGDKVSLELTRAAGAGVPAGYTWSMDFYPT